MSEVGTSGPEIRSAPMESMALVTKTFHSSFHTRACWGLTRANAVEASCASFAGGWVDPAGKPTTVGTLCTKVGGTAPGVGATCDSSRGRPLCFSLSIVWRQADNATLNVNIAANAAGATSAVCAAIVVPNSIGGLVDCVSFTLMLERGITKALSADDHFQQCGFLPLLRSVP